MRNRLGFLSFLGLTTALFGCACDGQTACQTAAGRIEEVCGTAAFTNFRGLDRPGFESACGSANLACQSCIDTLLADAAGCASLTDCEAACVCTGAICPGDAGTDSGGIPDAGLPDAPIVCSSTGGPAGSQPGAACQRMTSCRDDACNPQLRLVGDVTLYSGSMCGDECDPNATTNQCGDCGGCSEYTYLGRNRIPELAADAAGAIIVLDGVCRSQCTPSTTTNGGCRTGYTCDIDSHLCVDACTNDTSCKQDFTDDGIVTNPAQPWVCELATGRCGHPGMAGVEPGDPCTVDADCMEDGQCLTGDAIPDGYCTRVGCNAAGFECATGETCSLRGLGGPSWCLTECMVGAEPEAERFGAAGHGAGCPVGAACTWNGQGEEPVGGCFPADYNDITTPNVGGACQTAGDCYSPFGYGACLFQTQDNVDSGMCAVANCIGMDANGILPGITTTTRICDEAAGELCVGFQGGDTYCLLGCDSAAECAPGYACPALLTGGGRVCWPQCFAAGDCRTGATCEGETGGVCDFDGPDNVADSGDEPPCFCSDRMPRTMPDGGVPDAGTAADAGTDAGSTLDAGVDASAP